VDATQRSLSLIEGEAALHQPAVKSVSLELLLAPRAGKKSALVGFGLDVDFENSW
jgi:hypothetical protein